MSRGLLAPFLALVMATCWLTVDHHAAWSAAAWTPAGPLQATHSRGAAALVPDGRVLLVGGQTPDGLVTSSAETFDPVTSQWTTVPNMANPRIDFTATTLNDGRVLIVGGSDGTRYLSSVEVFNPITTTWSVVPNMSTPRSSHTATLLPDGSVLVVGGFGSQGPLTSVERYDPRTNTWRQGESLRVARAEHAATLTADGKVLITGGYGAFGPLNSVELYDPVFDRFQGFIPQPSMLHARYWHTATLLPDGRILVAGGVDTLGSTATAELYNPSTGIWSPASDMALPRALHTATLLPDGTVLVAGGATLGGGFTAATADTQIFNPSTSSWSPGGSMTTTRYGHTATLLQSGRVLVAGGSSGNAPKTSEMYTPANLPTPTATAVVPTVPVGPPLTPPPPPISLTPVTVTTTPTPIPTSAPAPTATPTATTPAGPTFSLVAVRVETAGSPVDWNMTRAPISRVAAGTKVQISVYARFGTAMAGQAAVQVQITHNGTVYYTAGASEARVGSGDLWEHWSFTPKQTGVYTITGTLTALGQTQQLQAHLTATKTPPTFSFNRLVTENSQGKLASSFSRSERVSIIASITVRHAPAAVKVVVGQSLQYPSSGTWKALGKRVENSFQSASGTHRYTVTFYPQSPYSLVRMVIDVTVGKTTRTKAVTFSIHS